MRDLRTFPYRFRSTSPEGGFKFSLARESDVPRIAQMYRGIQINAHNYKERLNPDMPDNFQKKGGMFQVPNETEICALIRNPDSCFATARRGKRIVASLWLCLSDPDFISCDADAGLAEAIRQGKALFLREIIVDGNGAECRSALPFLYTVMWAACNAGFLYAPLEVYQIDAYFDGEAHPSELLNERSYRLAKSCGARVLGKMPPKTVQADGFAAEITPVAAVFECAFALREMRRQLQERKIIIYKEVPR